MASCVFVVYNEHLFPTKLETYFLLIFPQRDHKRAIFLKKLYCSVPYFQILIEMKTSHIMII